MKYTILTLCLAALIFVSLHILGIGETIHPIVDVILISVSAFFIYFQGYVDGVKKSQQSILERMVKVMSEEVNNITDKS